jgi:uncharacterized membrane protein
MLKSPNHIIIIIIIIIQFMFTYVLTQEPNGKLQNENQYIIIIINVISNKRRILLLEKY